MVAGNSLNPLGPHGVILGKAKQGDPAVHVLLLVTDIPGLTPRRRALRPHLPRGHVPQGSGVRPQGGRSRHNHDRSALTLMLYLRFVAVSTCLFEIQWPPHAKCHETFPYVQSPFLFRSLWLDVLYSSIYLPKV